jgi:hypothetical protein
MKEPLGDGLALLKSLECVAWWHGGISKLSAFSLRA